MKKESVESVVARTRALLSTGEPDRMFAEWEPILEAERLKMEEADRVTREILDLYIDI